MRQLLPGFCAGLTLALAVALPAAAQTFRVVTWQSDDFPGPLAGAGTNDPDVRRLRQMAGVLRPYNADVILLEGMPDRPTCLKLAGFLKPAYYTIASYHVFRGGVSNQPVAPSIAILTRRAPLSARGVDWRTSGQIDSPGGFNFVSVPLGSNALCFYAAHFVDAPAALTNARVAQANARKRELAAQYLLHHTRWLEGTLTNPVSAFVLAGNLGTGPLGADATGRLAGQAGFLRAAPLPAGEAGLMAPKEWFARNATFTGAPQLGLPRGFGYGPVLCELALKPPAPPAAPVLAAAPAPAGPGSKPAPTEPAFRKFPVDERFVWLAVPVLGAVVVLLMLLLPYRWLVARRQAQALVLRRSRNAVVVDFAPPAAQLDPASAAGALPEGGVAAAWEERARDAEQRASKAAAVVREGLMPQLVRLMREKIFQRLSSQRAHLLDSHLNGTMAVLELEERLEKIQSQFATRLAAREQRIAELEAELAAKENIIRELIKAQARLAGRVSNDS